MTPDSPPSQHERPPQLPLNEEVDSNSFSLTLPEANDLLARPDMSTANPIAAYVEEVPDSEASTIIEDNSEDYRYARTEVGVTQLPDERIERFVNSTSSGEPAEPLGEPAGVSASENTYSFTSRREIVQAAANFLSRGSMGPRTLKQKKLGAILQHISPETDWQAVAQEDISRHLRNVQRRPLAATNRTAPASTLPKKKAAPKKKQPRSKKSAPPKECTPPNKGPPELDPFSYATTRYLEEALNGRAPSYTAEPSWTADPQTMRLVAASDPLPEDNLLNLPPASGKKWERHTKFGPGKIVPAGQRRGVIPVQVFVEGHEPADHYKGLDPRRDESVVTLSYDREGTVARVSGLYPQETPSEAMETLDEDDFDNTYKGKDPTESVPNTEAGKFPQRSKFGGISRGPRQSQNRSQFLAAVAPNLQSSSNEQESQERAAIHGPGGQQSAPPFATPSEPPGPTNDPNDVPVTRKRAYIIESHEDPGKKIIRVGTGPGHTGWIVSESFPSSPRTPPKAPTVSSFTEDDREPSGQGLDVQSEEEDQPNDPEDQADDELGAGA